MTASLMKEESNLLLGKIVLYFSQPSPHGNVFRGKWTTRRVQLCHPTSRRITIKTFATLQDSNLNVEAIFS